MVLLCWLVGSPKGAPPWRGATSGYGVRERRRSRVEEEKFFEIAELAHWPDELFSGPRQGTGRVHPDEPAKVGRSASGCRVPGATREADAPHPDHPAGRTSCGPTSSRPSAAPTRPSPSSPRTSAPRRCRKACGSIDLRHTCASLLIAQGASVKAVQAQLGHATASITLDTYGHLFPSEMETPADRLELVRDAALAKRPRTQRGPTANSVSKRAGR
jgi:hypothetical protein